VLAHADRGSSTKLALEPAWRRAVLLAIVGGCATRMFVNEGLRIAVVRGKPARCTCTMMRCQAETRVRIGEIGSGRAGALPAASSWVTPGFPIASDEMSAAIIMVTRAPVGGRLRRDHIDQL